jgi:ankyrin repeat protein
MLVSNGADVNARCQVPKWAVWFSGSLRYNFFGTSSQTETALTIACRQASHQGYDRIIQALIDGGAEINAEGGREGSALAVAAHKGYLRTMQVLLKNGADVNMRLNGFCYDNGLTNNILRRYPEAARNIELVGIPPCTALHLACAEGNLTTVRLLLDHGADVHAQGGIFGSAIHTACYKGDRKMVQMLISYGADINAPGSGYESPIQAAWSQASHGTGHFAIVLLLRSEGAVVPWSEEEIREKMWIKSLHL